MAPANEEPCQKLNGAIGPGCNLFRPLTLGVILAHASWVPSSVETRFSSTSIPLPCHFLEFATERYLLARVYLHSPKHL